MAEGVFNKIILWAFLGFFLVIFLVAIFSKTGLIPSIANLALGAERFLPVEPQKDVKASGKSANWLKILEEYEKKKCVVDKYTCKIQNVGCQCFTSTQRDNREAPDTCTTEKPYCYDGLHGCKSEGPDIVPGNYLKACQDTNKEFILAPKCEIDERCAIKNAPCSCNTKDEGARVCLQGQYCYNGIFGCSSSSPETGGTFRNYC